MSGTNSGNQTSSDDDGDDEFPIAAMVCLGVGAYVILIIGIIILKQYCTSRGKCKSHCCEASTEEGGGCCSCNGCSKANEACPCCCKCNLDGCLSKMCGKPKKINCIDVILCNCGGCTERSCNPFNCCGCGCCPKDIHCCSCSGICTDCCNSDSEPGTCGCLCLEVKLRSPRGGSTRRTSSAPPSFHQESLRQFNTHSGPEKNNSVISNGKLFDAGRKQFEDGDGDSVLTQDSITGRGYNHISNRNNNNNKNSNRYSNSNNNNNNNNVKMRSSSHSPKFSPSTKFRHTSHTAVKDVNVTPRPSDRNVSKDPSVHLRRNASLVSSSSQENNLNNSNDSIKISSNRRKSSKLRKSVRSGQRSQRFPNQVLVNSDSLNTSNSSGRFESLKSHGRSLPEPFSGVRRPLPSIGKANKTQ